MRDDERDMEERHARQDLIINQYTIGMGLVLALVVALGLLQAYSHIFGG